LHPGVRLLPVDTRRPEPVDLDEPRRVAEAVAAPICVTPW
jgi:lipoate synthase